MPPTLHDLLAGLAGSLIVLAPAATFVTGLILRLLAAWHPESPVSANGARGIAIGTAFALAILAYAGQALRGDVIVSDEGIYQVLLVASAVAGGSQTLYSGYKAVKDQVTHDAPAD